MFPEIQAEFQGMSLSVLNQDGRPWTKCPSTGRYAATLRQFCPWREPDKQHFYTRVYEGTTASEFREALLKGQRDGDWVSPPSGE